MRLRYIKADHDDFHTLFAHDTIRCFVSIQGDTNIWYEIKRDWGENLKQKM